jgi:hypothetical protein
MSGFSKGFAIGLDGQTDVKHQGKMNYESAAAPAGLTLLTFQLSEQPRGSDFLWAHRLVDDRAAFHNGQPTTDD